MRDSWTAWTASRLGIHDDLPAQDDLVIKTIQLHMLKTPPFIDTLRQDGFSQPGQVRRMEHAYLYAIAKLGH